MDVVIEHKGQRYWTLRASELYAGETPRIDWATLIPQATGTRAQRSHLTTAAKQALTAMIESPRRGSGALNHATINKLFGRLRQLVRWMVSQEIWRFSELTPEDAATYLHTIRPKPGGAKQVSLNIVQRHMNVLRSLWDCRVGLRDALRFDINHIEQDLLGSMQLRRTSPWRPIDEAYAMRLLRAAKDWTDAHAGYVGSLLERLWNQQETAVDVTYTHARRKRESFYEAVSQEPEFRLLADKLGMADAQAYSVLRAAVGVLEGAVLTSLLFLVGLRAQEIVRLDADCVVVPGDGDPGNLLLAGIAAKKGGRRRTWAITSEVKESVDALRTMLAIPRKLSGQSSLVLQGSAVRCAMFPSSRLPKRARSGLVSVRLRRFARAALPGESDVARGLHAHAARKTFARFVVLRDKRVLESLAYHFGHTHRAITDGYYVGADIELALLLDAENREDLARSLADLLTSRNIAGKASKAFIANREPAAGLRGKAALQSTVARLMSQGIQLAPCDWGYCVYSKALSACQGDAKGPNEAHRTAEVCSGCSNFAVTERHRAWWEERVVRDEQFLKRGDVPAQSLMVVQRRLSRSKELLAELNAGSAPARATAKQEGTG